ncbi:MAG: hypothetical protein Q8R70_13385 [Methanoregula sp.]|nr:hypothetical protein [Methanoregula sp.]
MARRSKTYIWQFVIGLGFVSGLWTAIGIDPEEFFLNLTGRVVDTMYPDPNVRTLFLILPTLLLLVSIISAYKKGRLPGLVAVIVAYAAGLSILVSVASAILLLVLAIIIGYLATNRRLVKKPAGL